MTQRHHRTIVAPGHGLVIRWPSAVIVIGGTIETITSGYEAISDSGEPLAPGRLIERLRALDTHDIAAAVITPAGIRLMRHGAGRAEVVDATGAAVGAAEYDVDATAAPIWLGIGDLAPPESSTLPHDLIEGVVPGRGALLEVLRPAALPENRQAAFEIADLLVADHADRATVEPSRRPLPTSGRAVNGAGEPSEVTAGRRDEVLGIECSRGHFNNPIAAYCQVCGISMVHLTHHLVPGSRPTLGYIVFDNGATYALDRPYLIGREPAPEPNSGFDPLVADDIDHTVSREHAELSYDGWNVIVADLGSTNGTFHWDTTHGQWERVMPNRPVVVAPGVSVAVGRTTFVYETVARSV